MRSAAVPTQQDEERNYRIEAVDRGVRVEEGSAVSVELESLTQAMGLRDSVDI